MTGCYLQAWVSSGAITIALIPSESRETKLEMTRMDGVKFREPGSLSNDYGDGNENGNKAKGLDKENNNSARASRFFVHFFVVVARLRRESA